MVTVLDGGGLNKQRVIRIKGEALTLAQGDGWQRNVAAKGEQA